MSELKPCPWCGSDIRLSPINVPWSDNSPCWAIWHVDGTKAYEAKCPMEMGGYDTEAEAIAAWNTRAERTCENVTDNKEANQFECSKCHCIVQDAEDYYVNVYERGKFSKGNTYGWNYCPNCGGKVER